MTQQQRQNWTDNGGQGAGAFGRSEGGLGNRSLLRGSAQSSNAGGQTYYYGGGGGLGQQQQMTTRDVYRTGQSYGANGGTQGREGGFGRSMGAQPQQSYGGSYQQPAQRAYNLEPPSQQQAPQHPYSQQQQRGPYGGGQRTGYQHQGGGAQMNQQYKSNAPQSQRAVNPQAANDAWAEMEDQQQQAIKSDSQASVDSQRASAASQARAPKPIPGMTITSQPLPFTLPSFSKPHVDEPLAPMPQVVLEQAPQIAPQQVPSQVAQQQQPAQQMRVEKPPAPTPQAVQQQQQPAQQMSVEKPLAPTPQVVQQHFAAPMRPVRSQAPIPSQQQKAGPVQRQQQRSASLQQMAPLQKTATVQQEAAPLQQQMAPLQKTAPVQQQMAAPVAQQKITPTSVHAGESLDAPMQQQAPSEQATKSQEDAQHRQTPAHTQEPTQATTNAPGSGEPRGSLNVTFTPQELDDLSRSVHKMFRAIADFAQLLSQKIPMQ